MKNSKKRSQLRYSPKFFVESILGDTMWEMQSEIVDSVIKNPRTTVRSCHGSGKTFIAARIVLQFMNSWPHAIVVTTAPTFTQVKDLLWKEIRSAHAAAKFKLPGVINDTRYEIGEDWYAVGRSTDEPSNFQGYHAPFILVVVDEAGGVSPEIYEALEGIISTGYARLLLIGNPTDPTNTFFNTFKSPIYNKIHISCFYTPNFAPFRVMTAGQVDVEASVEKLMASTEKQRRDAKIFSNLVAPQWVYERVKEWGIDSPMFYSRCLGEFPLEGDDTLIPLRYALAAVNKKIEETTPSPHECLGVDVARYGSDKTVLAYLRGQTIVRLESYNRTATTEVAGRIAQWKKEHEFGYIRIDDTGVGGGVTDLCRENKIEVEAVNVGEKPDNDDDINRFINKRGQYFWDLSQKFRNGEISIPDHESLIAELTGIHYKPDSKGRIVIESKEEMRKRGMKSPDFADAVMLACFKPTIGQFFSRDEQFNQQFDQYRPVTAGLRSKSF